MLYPEDYEDEPAPDRVLGWSLLAWLFVVALIVAALVHEAHAEAMSFKDPLGNSVQLFDEPCYEAPPWLGLHKATMLYQGKLYQACWRAFGSLVVIIDAEGDASSVPMEYFRKADGA